MTPAVVSVAVLYGAATLVAAAAAAAIWRHRQAPGARPLGLMLLATAVWSLCDLVELTMPSVEARRLVSQVQYLGVVSAAPLFLHAAVRLSGRTQPLTRRVVVAIWSVPVLTLVAAWTSDWHRWLWTGIQVPPGKLGPGVYEYGPWFWVLAADHYVLWACGSLVLLRAAGRVRRPYRGALVGVVAAIALPWAGNVAYVFKLGPWPGVNWLAVSTIATGLVLARLAFRAGLFDVLPAARDAVVDLVPEAVVVMDRDRRLLLANQSARRMLPLPAVGEPLPDAFAFDVPADGEWTSVPAVSELELPGPPPRWVEVRSWTTADRWGTPAARTLLIADISLRKQVEQAREALIARAAQETAAKSAFVAHVSHEIRTPLNAVLGTTALLRDTLLDPLQREYVELLTTSGETLLALVDDVLDFSRLDASRVVLERVPFDPRSVVSDVVRILGAVVRGRDLRVEGEVDASVPAAIAGDPARLRQVLLNLGGNAVKFTERGHVRVRITRDDRPGSGLTVRVEDTGVGIAPGDRERLFEPYSQGGATIARKYGGTGLGLAICRQLVERMGGVLDVESEPGRGATFFCTLPLESADAPTSRPAGDTASDAVPPARRECVFDTPRAPVSRPRRVLVAEDNAVNQVVIVGLLRKLGCDVDAVSDGRQALAALSREPYDLVLMDWQMPQMDGVETARRIRAGEAGTRARSVPIIAVTASATGETRAACLQAGMNGYLTKPITPLALRSALDRWMALPPAESLAS